MGLHLQLIDAVADRLLSLPYFEDIPVLARRKKDLGNEIQNTINNIGIACAVVVTELTANFPNLFGPHFDLIKLQVGVVENRLVNGTGKLAEDVIEQAANALHQYCPANLTSPLSVDTPTIVEAPAETATDKNKRLMVLRLKAAGGLAYTLPQVAALTSAVGGGLVTLGCATPGAAIFYRTDGKQPNPRYGAGSTLYTGPFAASGVTVKARAWLAGYETSGLLQIAV